jgi:hypothetical protein
VREAAQALVPVRVRAAPVGTVEEARVGTAEEGRGPAATMRR